MKGLERVPGGDVVIRLDQIRERLQQLKTAGCDVLFIPSLFRPLPELRRDLDRFIAEIAPAFR